MQDWNGNKIPLHAALENANEILEQLDSDNKTTRANHRTIGSISYTTMKEQTRSSKTKIDTLLYIINYSNNDGFAILSADKRLNPIYAIADKGNLNWDDTVENRGLAEFHKMMQASISSRIVGVENVDTPRRWIPENVSFKLKAEDKVLALLWPNVLQWNQHEPYNIFCFDKQGRRALAGCVPISVVQAMSFFDTPSSWDGERLIWRSIKKGNDNEVLARLIRKLGNKDLLDVEYGTVWNGGSSAYTSNVKRTLEAMGYVCGSYGNFTDGLCRERLKGSIKDPKNRGPFLMSALPEGESYGHSWVIDGYIRNSIYIHRNEDSDPDNYYLWDYDYTLFHCVWGWSNGQSNGYFYWDVNLRNFSGSADAVGSADDKNRTDIGYNFNQRVRCLLDFYPKK